MAADHAEAHNMTIVIEPICWREGNILRTVADGLAMAKRVNRPGIKALADLYHIYQEEEPMQNTIDAAEWLAHVHIAEPVKRSYPGNDAFDFTDFFTALQKAGYDGRVSCECKFDNFDEDVEVAFGNHENVCLRNECFHTFGRWDPSLHANKAESSGRGQGFMMSNTMILSCAALSVAPSNGDTALKPDADCMPIPVAVGDWVLFTQLDMEEGVVEDIPAASDKVLAAIRRKTRGH